MNLLVKPQVEATAVSSNDIAKLSVIVPFRHESTLPHLLSRLEELCQAFPKTPDIELMIVDTGSDEDGSLRAKAICERTGARYLYHPSRGQIFSIGAARDFGVSHARGDIVTFLDVDLRTPPDFWPRLLNFIEVYGLRRRKKSFFVIPCLYLSQEGTADFVSRTDEHRFNEALLRWLHGDNAYVESMAPCSSVMVVNRAHYLSVGGHRPEFRGHGYEDFELIHRLLVEDGRLPRAFNYYHDAKDWNNATYNGFRAQFALLGRPALLANLFVVHLWHPRSKAASSYNRQAMQQNRELWLELFKEFDQTKRHPRPIEDCTIPASTTVIFAPQDGDVYNCLRDVLPYWGRLIFLREVDFSDSHGGLNITAFETAIRHLSVSRIVFPNPYGNQLRLEIYKWCRRNRFPYISFDRGALPDSWFFDQHGFNADSSTYRRKAWDRKLSQEQLDLADAYIRQCLISGNSLEEQGPRLGAQAVAEKLGVGGRKVLFVPLQRPSDTVIKYFAGSAGDLSKFVSFIDAVAQQLKQYGWIVVCKKHPLETVAPALKHAVYAPDDTHFLDLLELADAVALINSGVGVYAMMMGKPCYIFGRAFYTADGLNVRCRMESPTSFVKQVLEGHTVDQVLARKFVYHLIERVYSFGKSTVKRRTEKDGSLRTATTAIDFYDLKLPGVRRQVFDYPEDIKIEMTAPLFERYKLDIFQRKKTAASSPATAAAPGNLEKPATSPKETVTGVSQPSTQKPASQAASQPSPQAVATTQPAAVARASKTRGKLAKLVRNPAAFFRDSRFPFLRPVARIFA